MPTDSAKVRRSPRKKATAAKPASTPKQATDRVARRERDPRSQINLNAECVVRALKEAESILTEIQRSINVDAGSMSPEVRTELALDAVGLALTLAFGAETRVHLMRGRTVIDICAPEGPNLGALIGKGGVHAQALRLVIKTLNRHRSHDMPVSVDISSFDLEVRAAGRIIDP